MPYVTWIIAFCVLCLPASADSAKPKDMACSDFLKSLYDKTREQWEVAIVQEVKAGRTPAFNKIFVTIKVEDTDSKGKSHTLLYEVSPDYLAIGSDVDFVRIPLTPMAAQPIADHLNCILPTRKMVDQIYKQASIKLPPKPLTENRNSLSTFVEHNRIIESQRVGKPIGSLVAGIKKDVVVTNLLQQRENRVAIYGWHQLDGKPIQPLTTVHVNWYVDYSHGIRLVKRQATLDGKGCDLRDLLKNPDLCFLISDEGPIEVPHY